MTWWVEIDVTGWAIAREEPRGKREKAWLQSPAGELHLRKEFRATCPSETPLELFAFQIMRELGIPSPSTAACTWDKDTQCGVLSKSFVAKGENKHLGSTILSRSPDYNQEDKFAHTLARLRSSLTTLAQTSGQEPAELLLPMARILYVDCLLGLADRHQENWAVLESKSGYQLSPVYDLDSCLAAQQTDTAALVVERSPDKVAAFADRCPSGFGDGGNFLKMRLLPAMLSSWPEWTQAKNELACQVAELDFKELVFQIPQHWLSDDRKLLACCLLEYRKEWLLKC